MSLTLTITGSKKSIAVFIGIFIAITFICGFIAIHQLSKLNQQALRLASDNQPKLQTATRLRIDFPQLQRAEQGFILNQNTSSQKIFETNVVQTIDEINQLIADYKNHDDLTEQETFLILKIEQDWRSYLLLQDKVFKLLQEKKFAQLNEDGLLNKRLELYDEMNSYISLLMNYNNTEIYKVAEQISVTYQDSRKLLILSMLICMLAGSASIVFFHKQLAHQESLQHQAHHDILTGLYNRRYLFKKAKKIFQRHHQLAILMVDIDHFKLINDRLGHDSGDIALCQLAQVMRESLRDEDILVRFGGEEFVLILPDTSQQQAELVAERLRQQVGEIVCYTTDLEPFSFTLSIGVTGRSYQFDNLTLLLQETDKRLYQAKQKGRNQIIGDVSD